MSDVIRDGVSVEKQTAGQKPESAPAQSEAEKALMEGMTLYQAGDHRGALALLRPLADRGDGSACFLVAQIYKKDGDLMRCRNYLGAAAQQGDGDAALMLAQEYAREGDGITALEWAEQAHELKAVGAGQLMLRLGKHKKDWEIVVWKALSELEWLPDKECVELCQDLKEVLEGGHIPEEQMPGLVEPVVKKLMARNPAAANILLEPFLELKKKQEEEEKAEKEREEERREQQKAKAKKDRNEALTKSVIVNVFLSLAIALGLNCIIHRIVSLFIDWEDLSTGIWVIMIGGYINCHLCYTLVSAFRKKVEGKAQENILKLWLVIAIAIIAYMILGNILSIGGLFIDANDAFRFIAILMATICGLYARYSRV